MKNKTFLYLLSFFLLFVVSCKKDKELIQLQLGEDFTLNTNVTTNSIYVSWPEVSNATSYTIELSNASGNIEQVYQTKNTEYTFEGLSSGMVYYFRLKANQPDVAIDSEWSERIAVRTKLSPPSLRLDESDFDFLAVGWTPVSGAESYDLQLFNEDNELLEEINTTETEYTFDELEAGKTYFIKIRVNGNSTASDFSAPFEAITSVFAKIHGLPVSWMFAEKDTQTDYLGNPLTPAILQSLQPQWATDFYMKSEALPGYGENARLSVVSLSGQASGFAYNNGHPYLRGLMHNDYWLFTIPVKGLTAGRELSFFTELTGSGSGPGPFILEWSSDNSNWIAVDAKTESIMNGANAVDVTYTFFQGDNLNSTGQPVTADIPITHDIEDGNLYIRLRVSADIRVTKNGSSISATGSTRLMSRTRVEIKN